MSLINIFFIRGTKKPRHMLAVFDDIKKADDFFDTIKCPNKYYIDRQLNVSKENLWGKNYYNRQYIYEDNMNSDKLNMKCELCNKWINTKWKWQSKYVKSLYSITPLPTPERVILRLKYSNRNWGCDNVILCRKCQKKIYG